MTVHRFALLTGDETRAAEKFAIDQGIASAQLMERAGEALARYVEAIVAQSRDQARQPQAAAMAAARTRQGGQHNQAAIAGSPAREAGNARSAVEPLGSLYSMSDFPGVPPRLDQPGQKTEAPAHSGSIPPELMGSLTDTENGAAGKPRIVILSGPGSNGGDGFVLARRLYEDGWPVSLALAGDREALTGDSALMASLFDGPVLPFEPGSLAGAELIIDALLGIGLTRPLDGPIRTMVEAVNQHKAPALAVDIPTGIHADTGAVMGVAVRAARTLTFTTRKPGHLLFPGRDYCGIVDIAPVGLPPAALQAVQPKAIANDIAVWGRVWPQPAPGRHKYDRGHVAVISGGLMKAGASRHAARAALRAGAGLVSLFSPDEALNAHAAQLTSIMLRRGETADEIAAHLKDPRFTAVAIGPGLGTDAAAREKVLTCLASEAAVVLDADALTAFTENPELLFQKVKADTILTPHAGEFKRLFPDLAQGDRMTAVRKAAERCGGIVLLKGPDTAIANPHGLAAINVNAPPTLATAGSGDVLSGFIAALAGQTLGNGKRMPPFEATCGGVWLHGACAQVLGPGLIADDLPDAMPSVLRQLSGNTG